MRRLTPPPHPPPTPRRYCALPSTSSWPFYTVLQRATSQASETDEDRRTWDRNRWWDCDDCPSPPSLLFIIVIVTYFSNLAKHPFYNKLGNFIGDSGFFDALSSTSFSAVFGCAIHRRIFNINTMISSRFHTHNYHRCHFTWNLIFEICCVCVFYSFILLTPLHPLPLPFKF